MLVEPVAGNVYRVHSESSDKAYIVDLDQVSCTCPYWAVQRNKRVGQGMSPEFVCKHVHAAGNFANSGTQVVERAKAKQSAKGKAALKRQDEIVARFTKPGATKKVTKDAISLLADLAKKDG